MKREELLTKLANQVGQWPNGMLARVEEDGTHRFYWAQNLIPDGGYVFGFDDWLAERQRLRHQEWPEERIDIVSLNGPTGCRYPQSSGGMKFDGEKPRMDLLLADMPRALTEVGKVLTFGANKYAPGNWIHVENAEQRYRAAGLRHDLALSMGEQHDSETGLHHLAHEACCILFRLELALREQEATQ